MRRREAWDKKSRRTADSKISSGNATPTTTTSPPRSNSPKQNLNDDQHFLVRATQTKPVSPRRRAARRAKLTSKLTAERVKNHGYS